MNDAILASVKETLGLMEPWTQYDDGIMDRINTAITNLHYVAGFPQAAPLFRVTIGDETWTEYLGANPLGDVARSYIFTYVGLNFDLPHVSSFVRTRVENLMLQDLIQLDGNNPQV